MKSAIGKFHTPSETHHTALQKVWRRAKAVHLCQHKVAYLSDVENVETGNMFALETKLRGGNNAKQKTKLGNLAPTA